MTLPTITALPPAPSRADDGATFSTKADAFVAALPKFGTEANALGSAFETLAADTELLITNTANDAIAAIELVESNAIASVGLLVDAAEASEADAAVSASASATSASASATSAQIAEGFANFTGDYNPATAYVVGQSVLSGSVIYVAKQSTTGNSPPNATYWMVVDTGVDIGEFVTTFNDMSVSGFLVADGSAYLQASYPLLFAKIGFASNFIKNQPPSSLPTGTGNSVAFSHDSTYMSVAHATSPYVTIYKRSGDTFTKLANPATRPTGIGAFVAFSHDSTYMSVAHLTSPYVTIYKRSGDTFTKLADPATLPDGTSATEVSFSPLSTIMAVSTNGGERLTIYNRDGDLFQKIENPLDLSIVSGEANVSISPDGLLMGLSLSAEPYVSSFSIAQYDRVTEFLVPDIQRTDNASFVSPAKTWIKAV